MKEKNEVDRNSFVRRVLRHVTYILTYLIFFVGLILILVAHLIPQKPDIWPSLIKTLGIALFVPGTITFLQRYFITEFLYQQIRKDLEEILSKAIRSNFNIIEICTKKGIRQVYPAWSEFVNQVLPAKLKLLRDNLIVVGSALSVFSSQIAGGDLRDVIEKKLVEEKKFTFCTIEPNSTAARYRENELNQKNVATAAATASLTLFYNFKNEHPDKEIEILTLSEIVPKATFLCIDGEYLFVSYYFTSIPRASSLVIETHKDDPLFKDFKKDLERLRKAATPWNRLQEEAVEDVS